MQTVKQSMEYTNAIVDVTNSIAQPCYNGIHENRDNVSFIR